MRLMEDIQRTRHIGAGESDRRLRKNYIREVWDAMVTKTKQGVAKAESDKTRTQFWVTTIVTISIPIVVALCSWFSVHLINYGAQQARQESYEKETKRLEQVIGEKEKEIQGLKEKQQVIPVTAEPPRSKPRTRTAKEKKRKLNGQSDTNLRANPFDLRGQTIFTLPTASKGN